jgi:hypothetical protein
MLRCGKGEKIQNENEMMKPDDLMKPDVNAGKTKQKAHQM